MVRFLALPLLARAGVNMDFSGIKAELKYAGEVKLGGKESSKPRPVL